MGRGVQGQGQGTRQGWIQNGQGKYRIQANTSTSLLSCSSSFSSSSFFYSSSSSRHCPVVCMELPRAQVVPRVGNTFSRVPDPEARCWSVGNIRTMNNDVISSSGLNLSGDETDKEFKFMAGDGEGDKTLKYDPKNFSFRLKNRDSVVVEARQGRCSWSRVCCNSLYLALAAIALVLVIALLSTATQNYRCDTQTNANIPAFEMVWLLLHRCMDRGESSLPKCFGTLFGDLIYSPQ